MRNLFEDAIYLFDMEIEKPTIITSKADDNFELHVIPDYEYYREGYNHQIVGVALYIYLFKNDEIEERDLLDGPHMNSKYFFDYLRWFHESPQALIDEFYNTELEIINKN